MHLSNRILGSGFLFGVLLAPVSATELYRLYDYTPASQAANPVVARVEGSPIEIVQSELEVYLEAELPQEDYQRLSLSDKRVRLRDLIDQYLLLWDAEQRNACRDEKIRRMLEDTHNLLMSEQLYAEEIDSRNPETAERATEIATVFVEGLFQEANVRVNQESYDLLLELAREDDDWAERYFEYSVDETRHGSEEPPAKPGRVEAQLERILAVCDELAEVTVGQCLDAYHAIPIHSRPRLDRPEDFNVLLRDAFQHHLLFQEAERRGYREHPRVLELYQQNRNALMKMWAYERLWGEAAERMEALEREEDYERRLRSFYQENLDEIYTFEENGEKIAHVYEAIVDRVPQDYYDRLVERMVADHVAGLREKADIWIDETFFAPAR